MAHHEQPGTPGSFERDSLFKRLRAKPENKVRKRESLLLTVRVRVRARVALGTESRGRNEENRERRALLLLGRCRQSMMMTG